MSNTALEGCNGPYREEIRDAVYGAALMKIATWNLAGIKARMPVLLKWLEANSPDILVLQETKTVDDGFPRLELEAMGYNIATLGQKSWNGVAILSKLPFDEVHRGLPGDDSDEQARLIEAVVSVEGGVVRVCGIYLPNGNPVKTDKFDYKLALDGPAPHLHRGAAQARGAVHHPRRLQHHPDAGRCDDAGDLGQGRAVPAREPGAVARR